MTDIAGHNRTPDRCNIIPEHWPRAESLAKGSAFKNAVMMMRGTERRIYPAESRSFTLLPTEVGVPG